MGRPRAVVEGLPRGREAQIAFLAANGLKDIEIGERLGISPSTVSAYWKRTLESHNVRTRTELVALLLRRKIMRQEATMAEMQEEIDALQDEVRRLERLVRDMRPPVLTLDGRELDRSPVRLKRRRGADEDTSATAA